MFTQEEKDAFYKVVYTRRDIRSFLPIPVERNVIDNILNAGHHAPSVGFIIYWQKTPASKRGAFRWG